MRSRLLRRALTVALVIVAATGLTAVPAYASVGGCYDSHPTVTPCVNFGDAGGNKVRADFYLKHTPDAAYYSYRVAINADGQFHNVTGTNRLTFTGRYCCWTTEVAALPPFTHSAYTRVYIFDNRGILWLAVNSPTIYFYS